MRSDTHSDAHFYKRAHMRSAHTHSAHTHSKSRRPFTASHAKAHAGPAMRALAVALALVLSSAAAAARDAGVRTLPEIRLAVAEMQVIPAYASPRRRPNAEHRMKASPQKVATAWARSKIRAVGRADRARVIVLKASVLEVPVKGKSGLFRRGPDRRYDATLTISVEIRSDAGDLIGRAQATATRSQEVLKGVEGARLQEIWRDLSERLVSDAAHELNRQLQARLGRYLR